VGQQECRVELNRQAFKHAKRLIQSGNYIMESDWIEDQPSPEEKRSFLKQYGSEAYSEWFLALDETKIPENKRRYRFPIGDFKMVHRQGVMAAGQRAAQSGYPILEDAANDLLELIDEQDRENA
jgi:hypothetical protein